MREKPEIAFSPQTVLQSSLLSLDGHIQRGSCDHALAGMPAPSLDR
jgi:hypothetical protein